jgi:Domain of unknown function (DUF4349)
MMNRLTPPATKRKASDRLALFLVALAIAAGCKKDEAPPAPAVAEVAARSPMPADEPARPGAQPARAAGGGDGRFASGGKDAAKEAPTLAAAAEAGERRVIRNADLTLEVESGPGAQQRATAIAEAAGGFVISSDAQNMSTGGRPYVHATVVARVPAGRFGTALDELRKVGTRVVTEKVTGQDVTEEFIDLEARLRVQRALENQLLELLKQAKVVKEAVEVHREIAQVRSEIERVEGRRRFLVNQTDLSTITLRLHEPTPFIATSGGSSFGRELGRALGDAVEAAQAVVLFFIRALGVLLPLGVLVGLPIVLLVRRALRKRRQRLERAARPPVGGMGAV